jgi:TfoX/Sxy family transcriptional regulator of competence genes
MSYDAGLVERLRDAVARLGERGAREKNVFGGRGFLLGKNTFVIAWSDSLLAKLAPDEYDSALAVPGVEPFAPGGERPMGNWVVVPADVIADDPELAEWVEKSLRGVRAAPAPKARRAPAAAGPGTPAPKKSGRERAKKTSTKRTTAARRPRS